MGLQKRFVRISLYASNSVRNQIGDQGLSSRLGRNVRALVDTAVSAMDPGAKRSDSYALLSYLASLLAPRK